MKPANSQGIIVGQFGDTQMRALISAVFPDLDIRFNKLPGVHLAFDTINELCRKAISQGDFRFLSKMFELLDSITRHPDVDKEIPNAVQISFLVESDFESDNGKQAWNMIPANLKALMKGAA
jgi:hypothetical protein